MEAYAQAGTHVAEERHILDVVPGGSAVSNNAVYLLLQLLES